MMHSFLISPTTSPPRFKKLQNPQLSTTLFEHNKRSPTRFRQSAPKHHHGSFYANSHNCSHEEYQNHHLTFKPIINEIPFSLYPNNRGKISKSREEIRENLIQDGTRKIRERYWVKAEKELDETKACTFSPELATSKLEGCGQQVFEKLFKQAQAITKTKAETERKRLQQEATEISKLLAFKLSHNSYSTVLNSQKHNLNPIEHRISQIISQKLAHRKQLQQKCDKENEMTFTPQIGQKTQQIAKKKIQREQLKKNVVDRLMEEVKKRNLRRQKMEKDAQTAELTSCTFKPEINPYVGDYDFMSRASRMDRLRSQEDDLHPFQPKIDKLSELIVMHTRGEEDLQAKMNRLSIEPIHQKNKNIEKLSNQFYRQFTFKPSLNQISTSTNPHPRIHTCQHPPPQVFSFQPEINENSRMLRPFSTQSARMKTKKKQVEYRMQAEYEEMKQCSFQPKINSKRHQGTKGLEDVEGMDKYMLWRDLAKKKEEEQRERQKQVFGWALKYDLRVNNNQIIG